jgi:hypothetical protein
MQAGKKPTSVIIAAALAVLPVLLVPLWLLVAALSGNPSAQAWASSLVVALVTMVPAGWLAFALLRGSKVALQIARFFSWAVITMTFFVSVYEFTNWRGDTSYFIVLAILLLPAIGMLIATSQAQKTLYFSGSR